ncbi:hypothetical protein [Tepidibacter thalassicus]|uniref:PsbP protein n=1 Tax=Tepidibacter thalassicus DSM 15285 TaxID=1123350 RepID=A0A1M5R8K1_9FIRM|nr:hypothetical protein [Tepidibacter thalassicus]SHH22561.1 hypothetical protein SAMN02744040_01271 [Tepidibacter thalassicus DSM 15285]
MMKKITLLFIAILLSISLFGCNKKDKVIYTEPAPPKKEIQAKKRPENKTDTIKINNSVKDINLKLYDDENLEFTTYIPEDMIAKSKQGDFLSIYANFNGKQNKDAKLRFFSPIKTVTSNVKNMKEVAINNLKKDGFEILDNKSSDKKLINNSELEFDIIKKKDGKNDIVGTVSIFNHNNRFYYVIVQYPLEYKEKFMPRAEKILENIMFYDEKNTKNK